MLLNQFLFQNRSSPKVILNIVSDLNKISQFSCSDCIRRMAAIPQGMFAVHKVRANMSAGRCDRSTFESRPDPSEKKRSSQWDNNKGKDGNWGPNFPQLNQQILDHPPAKYNSKMMNSIWGLYNRYSVHNLKKIAGDAQALGHSQQQAAERTSPRGSPNNVTGNNGGGNAPSTTPAKHWESILSSIHH